MKRRDGDGLDADPLAEETLRKAGLVVCKRATSRQDADMLLQMLGLKPSPGPVEVPAPPVEPETIKRGPGGHRYFADAGPAIHWIGELVAAGMSLREISFKSGSKDKDLAVRIYNRRPAKVRAETAQGILAIPIPKKAAVAS